MKRSCGDVKKAVRADLIDHIESMVLCPGHGLPPTYFRAQFERDEFEVRCARGFSSLAPQRGQRSMSCIVQFGSCMAQRSQWIRQELACIGLTGGNPGQAASVPPQPACAGWPGEAVGSHHQILVSCHWRLTQRRANLATRPDSRSNLLLRALLAVGLRQLAELLPSARGSRGRVSMLWQYDLQLFYPFLYSR